MTKTFECDGHVYDFELANKVSIVSGGGTSEEWRVAAVRCDGAPADIPRVLWLRDSNTDALYRLACDRVERSVRLRETVRYHFDDYFWTHCGLCMVRDGDDWRVDRIGMLNCLDWDRQQYAEVDGFFFEDVEKVRALRVPDVDTLYRTACDMLIKGQCGMRQREIPPFRLSKEVALSVLMTINVSWEDAAFDWSDFAAEWRRDLDAGDLTLDVERAVVAHEGFLETAPRFRGWTFLRNLERKLGRCKADARPSMRLDGAGRPKYLDSLLIADVAREITRYYRALGRIEPIHDDYEWPKKEHPGRATLTADCQSRANGRPHEPESEPASDEEDRAFVRRNRDYQTDILVPVLCALFLQKTVNGAWCFPGDNYAPFFHRHRNEPEKILAVLVEGAKYRW